MSDYYDHDFEGPVERFGVGKTRKVWYSVLFVPDALHRILPFSTYLRLRVEGEINDVPVALAFIPSGDGRHYGIVSPKVLKASGHSLGETARMRFRIDDQDRVDVPDDLQAALDARPDICALWDDLTPGKRRGSSYHVDTAKRLETRRKRIDAVFEAVTERNGNILKR